MSDAPGARLFESQMAMYTSYHRDRRNRLTHFVGIPAIVVSLIVVLAPVRFSVGEVELSWAIAMTATIGAAMAVLLAPALAFGEWLAGAYSTATTWWVFAALFVGGWALQLLGHVYEGRRPAFLSNLFQALIGPMFLVAEIFFALGLRPGLRERVEALVSERYPEFAISSPARESPVCREDLL